MDLKTPYLLFLGDAPDRLAAKTALGLVDWRRDICLGQMRLDGCAIDAGLPDLSPGEAAARGARTLVIGVVNAGGTLPDHWLAALGEAIEAGLDIASGLHQRLGDIPALAEAADRKGVALIDIRRPRQRFATGKGAKRSGRRLLTVGTDCSVGKKYAALALARGLSERGAKATFRATGQTGILIAGSGVPIDAVIADFISGAAEWLSPDAATDHWDVIEGQGSLLHPSYAGVSLGLLHGSQPDAFVVCHEPTRRTMRGVLTPVPSIEEVIELTERHGRLTNPAIHCVGIAVNTSALERPAAQALLEEMEHLHGVPAVDPLTTGVGPIVDRILARSG